jgi:hypothetical protein
MALTDEVAVLFHQMILPVTECVVSQGVEDQQSTQYSHLHQNLARDRAVDLKLVE